MSTVAEIEEAASKLEPREFQELLARLKERDASGWDRELEDDAKSGRLDQMRARLEQEDAGEPEVSLNDFLDQAQLPKAL